MTISSEIRKAGPFSGNDATTAFPFAFKVFAAADIFVVRANAIGVETVLVLNSDYTVALNANQNTNPGGTVTLVAPLATGLTMVVSSDIENLQPTDLTNQGGFYPAVINNSLDRATIQIQQLQEQVDRAAKLPITSSADAESLVEDLIRLADSADNIDTVAGSIADVNTVAGDIANVNTVASSIASVNTVAGNIAAVQNVDTNMAAVIAAPDEADAAAASALAAATSESEADGSATAAAASAAAAATSYDNFDDRYLGAKSAAPATDNDGNTLLIGATYWDTPSAQMFTWSGTEWRPTFLVGNTVRELVLATAGQTVVATPTYLVGSNTLQVFVNGVKLLLTTDYAETDQNTITFVSGLQVGDEVELIAQQAFAVDELRADLATPAGSSLVGFEWAPLPAALGKIDWGIQTAATGVNALRYVPPAEWAGILNGTGSYDATAAVQAAMAAHSDVVLPTGTWRISDTLRLTKGGQKLYGAGRNWVPGTGNGTHILWIGLSTKNVIELDSGRVDGGGGSSVLVGAQVGGFGLSFAAGFSALNGIFVRDGVFHSIIENIYMRPYAGDAPTDSMLKLHSGAGYSYPLGLKVRDVVIRGDMLTYTGGPVPRGVWVQSALESVFDNVRVFDCEDGWVIGDDAPNYRNVSNVQFFSCHSELGPGRDNATVNGCSIRFYAGTHLDFFGCKFNSSAGLDGTGGAHRCIRFVGSTATATGGNDLLGVSFDGCSFWGFNISNYAMEVSASSALQDIVFDKCRFINFEEGTAVSTFPATPQIAFRDCSYPRTLFNGSEIASFAAFGIRTGARTINATSRLVLEDNEVFVHTQSAFLIGSVTSNDSKPILVTAVQQSYSNYGMEIGLFNPDAAAASIGADNVVRLRPILDREIIAQNKKDVASIGSIGNGGVYSTDIAVPGVVVGDHVFASLRFPKQVSSFALDGAMLGAYVPAANTIRVQIMNRRGAAFTPPSNATFYACKAFPRFDIYQVESYDAPSINNATQLTYDVTVSGAAVGDLVTVAASADLQGVFLRGVVKSANTVTLYFYNVTGAAINLPVMSYGIGIIKVPVAV